MQISNFFSAQTTPLNEGRQRTIIWVSMYYHCLQILNILRLTLKITLPIVFWNQTSKLNLVNAVTKKETQQREELIQ